MFHNPLDDLASNPCMVVTVIPCTILKTYYGGHFVVSFDSFRKFCNSKITLSLYWSGSDFLDCIIPNETGIEWPV
jgi:hypothetical protein